MSLAKFSLGLSRITRNSRIARAEIAKTSSASSDLVELMNRVRNGLSSITSRSGDLSDAERDRLQSDVRVELLAKVDDILKSAIRGATVLSQTQMDELVKLVPNADAGDTAELVGRLRQTLATTYANTSGMSREEKDRYVKDARGEIGAIIDAIIKEQVAASASSSSSIRDEMQKILVSSQDLAGKATAVLNEVRTQAIDVTDEIGPILEATTRRFLTMRATAEVHMAATTAVTKTGSDEVSNDLAAMTLAIEENTFQVEDFVTRQRDKIEEIRTLGFGGYLDAYARAFVETSRGGNISPQRRAELQRALGGIPQFVRNAGPAGMGFDFAAFEADLLRLIRDSRESGNVSRRGGKPNGGVTTSGRSGSPEGGCDGKDDKFSSALKRGSWTGGN